MTLMTRLNRIREISKNRSITKMIDIRPRNPDLLKYEGSYTIDYEEMEHQLPDVYYNLIKEYRTSKSSMKFTKWLMKMLLEEKNRSTDTYREVLYLSHFAFSCMKMKGEFTPENFVSQTGKLIADKMEFKLSCRYNDLLRLADTKHYSSCLKYTKISQLPKYLADPDIGVIFVADKAGKFIWRALIRLCLNPEPTKAFPHVLLIYRHYGNAPFHLIYKKLNEMLPIYHATDTRNGLNVQTLESATVHNNIVDIFKARKDYENKPWVDENMKPYLQYNKKWSVVNNHTWCDHKCNLNFLTNRVQMYGIKIELI
jgi:hypothetical protein